MTPGTSPPRYSLSAATPATAPYKITGSDGGNKRPSDPEAGTRPSENPSGYLSFTSAGKTRPPSARMVTPEPPVKVVNSAHTEIAISASPPGIQPSSDLEARTSPPQASPH